jgi:predicted AAA+ superfamily ATPase
MKPWREIIIPHPDVLEGTFQQSEFAADITAVHTGKATREYQEAKAFYERTYITEGMRLLLTSVAKRLNAQGGDPVIQLQTAFGGGKTHTMLAVYHLACRPGSLDELPGIPGILDQSGIMDVPRARVAVIDGTDHAPGQSWKHGKQVIHTLWGEMAWQLGGEEGYAMVKESDLTGTSPGKEAIRALLERYAPCVILIDELVAYIRQFPEGKALSGGSFDSNLSFAQALTEATKLVPNAILLASLPESEVEAGSAKGVAALKALEKTFGRVQAIWKPVGTEESFEIVRRRLFEPVRDTAARDEVCRAFSQLYISEGSKLPGESQEARYLERLVKSYPVHPEIFDRLYEDWATIDGFQRTRGVLKLMAKVIYRLWKDQNRDFLILPGSLPLYDGETKNELVYHLAPGWDPVLDRDIDGERSETVDLENKEPRFGAVQAARRVARTVFFGTAPSSAGTRQNNARGLDPARIVLGCVQPGQTSSLFIDALSRVSDTLHYLNSSGERGQDSTRYWFDTRANLRREMEDRKRRFDDTQEVKPKLAETVRRLLGSTSFVDGLHVFTPHADISDDSALRLVVLPPEKFYTKAEPRMAFDEVVEIVKQHGERPRYRGNRLLFIAPDHGTLTRARDAVRTVLAWKSILDDVQSGRLNIDRAQEQQAKKELSTAEDALPRVVRECFRWLLCPVMHNPTDREMEIEVFPVNTSGSSAGSEIERICRDNELVVTTWSPIHLRDSVLKRFYWKADKPHVLALTVWEDMLRYLYLPRLRDRGAYEQTVLKGAAARDFFATAYGQHEGKYEGFHFGDGFIQVDDTLLLIEPARGAAYEEAEKKRDPDPAPTPPPPGGGGGTPSPEPAPQPPQPIPVPGDPRPVYKNFHGSVEVSASMAKMKLAQIADELINLLSSDPDATVKVTLEVSAEFPQGAKENTKRAVSENATSLNFKSKEWF